MTRPLPTGDEACVIVEGPWRHREISANGQRFHAVEAGEGPLVLLLHGFPQFWWSWRHVIPVLADAGFRVVTPDLQATAPATSRPAATTWRPFPRRRGHDPGLGEHDAMIAGHGWGGLLAWTTAVLHRAAYDGWSARHRPPARHAPRVVTNPAAGGDGWSAAAMQIPRARTTSSATTPTP